MPEHSDNITDSQRTCKTAKYKLTYFAVKGIAEGIRFLLCYMGADWEDDRIQLHQWAAYKHKTPWRAMPILEVDGKIFTQSLTIMRHLGKEAGLTGDDDWENAQIDIIAETLTDFRTPATAFMWERNEEVKKRKKEIWQTQTLPFYLEKLDSVVKENRGFLANGKLSWVDFLFVGMCEYLSYNAEEADMTLAYPSLHAHRKMISSLPQVAQWIARRPDSAF